MGVLDALCCGDQLRSPKGSGSWIKDQDKLHKAGRNQGLAINQEITAEGSSNF